MLEHLIRHDSYIKTVLEGRIEGRRGIYRSSIV